MSRLTETKLIAKFNPAFPDPKRPGEVVVTLTVTINGKSLEELLREVGLSTDQLIAQIVENFQHQHGYTVPVRVKQLHIIDEYLSLDRTA